MPRQCACLAVTAKPEAFRARQLRMFSRVVRRRMIIQRGINRQELICELFAADDPRARTRLIVTLLAAAR